MTKPQNTMPSSLRAEIIASTNLEALLLKCTSADNSSIGTYVCDISPTRCEALGSVVSCLKRFSGLQFHSKTNNHVPTTKKNVGGSTEDVFHVGQYSAQEMHWKSYFAIPKTRIGRSRKERVDIVCWKCEL